jgi:transposase
LGRPRTKPRILCADRGYSVRGIRSALARRGVRVVIPWRRDQERDRRGRRLDREVYRARNVVERAVGHLKEYRRIATRYEKLAQSYLAMIWLGFIRRYFRLLGLPDAA